MVGTHGPPHHMRQPRLRRTTVRQLRQALAKRGFRNVRDQEAPARSQYAPRFVDRLVAAALVADVADGDAGNDQVETGAFERQLAHVRRMQFDPFGDAFGQRVLLRGRHGVAPLVLDAPDIDAHGAALRQVFGGHQQHRAAAAAKIEHTFVATDGRAGQQVAPYLEFAATRGVQVDSHAQQDDDGDR